ncbi:hypothetical protein [Lysinibacillus sp. SGAir0095]|uniref:hypothetical protein n=1 Tax=Lysinibacillus sp. SGAir0095 TaxID=2070463 RepID=UPI0010CCDCF0|nr:hypothetical protein [Lysinibacillus sp. SGAir0095]QCR32238.1 hypothetical protein C1N55_08660 [Lysinibacillus sp. SGAir0095]
MNNDEKNDRLSEVERKKLMAEILPILEKKSQEEIKFALHLLTLKGKNELQKSLKRRHSQHNL